MSITNKKFAIVWNMPHKTSTNGGTFGYPDAEYLNKLKFELGA